MTTAKTLVSELIGHDIVIQDVVIMMGYTTPFLPMGKMRKRMDGWIDRRRDGTSITFPTAASPNRTNFTLELGLGAPVSDMFAICLLSFVVLVV